MFKFILATILVMPISAKSETSDELSKDYQESICNQLASVFSNTLLALKQKNDYTDILYYYHIQLKEENDTFTYLVFDAVKSAAKTKYESSDHKTLTKKFNTECKTKLKVDIIDLPKTII